MNTLEFLEALHLFLKETQMALHAGVDLTRQSRYLFVLSTLVAACEDA